MPKKKIESTEVENKEIEETVEQPVETVEETVEEVAETGSSDEVVGIPTESVGKKKAKKSVVKPASSKVEKKDAKEEAPKGPSKKHGKKYRNVVDLVEKGKEYEVAEAIELLKKTATPKFDSTVEIHVNLNVDPSNADHQVRGSVLMPAGLGKAKKIAVIANVDKEKEAKDAGADIVGGQELVEKIEKGFMDFEVVVATPDMMASVGKIGKILGTKGLMPNPKTGTVTNDVAKVVAEIKKGRANYKIDKSGILHSPVGKVSFKNEDLEGNIKAYMEVIHHAKPASLKGTFIKSIHLTTTMGPSVKLQK